MFEVMSETDSLEAALSAQEELEKAATIEEIIDALGHAYREINFVNEQTCVATLGGGDVLEDIRAIVSKRMESIILPKVFEKRWNDSQKEMQHEIDELADIQAILCRSILSDTDAYELVRIEIAQRQKGFSEYYMPPPNRDRDPIDHFPLPIRADQLESWRAEEIQKIGKRISAIETTREKWTQLNTRFHNNASRESIVEDDGPPPKTNDEIIKAGSSSDAVMAFRDITVTPELPDYL